MNVLGYRVTPDNGLSFALLVDGTPLAKLIGSSDDAFPYWIVNFGIPGWPPSEATPPPLQGTDIRIVTACSYEHVMEEISRLAAVQKVSEQPR